VTEKVVLVQ